MKKHLFFLFGALGLLMILTIVPDTSARGEEMAPAVAEYLQYLPAIFRNNQAASNATPTPTLISTAPPATATATLTPMPTATPVDQSTATMTPTASATPTMTESPEATLTATPTATNTPGATPTATATSIPFPDVTFSCRAEPASGDALTLIIHAELSAPAPFGGASFRLDFTDESGPIDEILRPLPFQLINFFSDDTAKDATGFLSKCDQADQCVATYTVTRTDVTRYIGTSVDCQY